MAPSKRVRLEADLPDDLSRDAPRRGEKKPSPPRRSRLGWFVSRLVVMLVLLAVLVGLAPTIISATGLWKSLLAAAAPELKDKISAGSLSLAWWSPVSIVNLTVRDEQGQPLAEAPLIRSHKTLLALATGYPDLGTFEITEPRAHVVLRQDGSNVEDFLAKLPQDESDGKGGAPVRIGLVLTRGTIALDDTIARRQWSLENLNLDLAWPTAADQPKSGKLSATVKGTGDLSAGFSWQPGAGDAMTMGAGQAEIKLNGLPTELVEGALRRFVTDIRPQGAVTLDASFIWTDDGKSQQLLVRQLAAPRLAIASPTLLAGDTLQADISSGVANVQIKGEDLEVRQFQLVSRVLQVGGNGSVSLASRSIDNDVDIKGQIDLAELSRQIPNALRLKPDTSISAGVAQFSLASYLQKGRVWHGTLRTDRIIGKAAGRHVEFEQPIELEATIADYGGDLNISKLTGKASFLDLSGQGSLAGGSVTVTADLDRLVAELGQLIDWRDIQLAGTLGAKVEWNQGQNSAWTAKADARVQNFVAAAAGLAPWRETDLQVGADVTGVLAGEGLQEINRATLSVVSAADRLEVNLTESVKEVSAAATWPLAFTVQGDLATWMPRLQPIVSLADWQFAGRLDARGAGRFSPTICQLAPTTVEVEQLEVAGPGLWIREPIAKLSTSGTWDQSKLTLTLPATTLESTSIALRADEIHLVAGNQPTVTGLVDFRGDPAKLSDWMGSRDAPRTWRVGGEMTGRIEIVDRGPAHEATASADIEKFVLLTPSQPPPQPAGRTALASASGDAWTTAWAENKVTLSGQASYDASAGKINVARSGLATDWATLAATGTISEVTTTCLTDLSGEIAYDLALVEQKIKTDLFPRSPQDDPRKTRSIDTLSLRGQEKRPFVLRGPLLSSLPAATSDPLAPRPLVPEQLVGEASLGWQAAQYVGLVAGPADFKAQLKQGVVHIGPLDIPVSDGRLTTAPRILLNAATPSVVVERGPLIQNVRITPEMCNQWLKYVAPLLADATEAEGKFSLDLEGASVPVFTPMTSTVQGSLAIHGAQVGPGPLAKQYLAMARQVKSIVDPTAAQGDNYGRWLLLPEHKVGFAVQDGVVSHDGLTMTAQNFVVTTKGHVRIADQAIDLDANIPIQDAWLTRDKQGLLAGLRGKSIPVKVTGTLTQFHLDKKAYENFGKQFASTAVQGFLDKNQQKVQGLIDKEAGKLLDGLFGPKPKPPAPASATPAPRATAPPRTP